HGVVFSSSSRIALTYIEVNTSYSIRKKRDQLCLIPAFFINPCKHSTIKEEIYYHDMNDDFDIILNMVCLIFLSDFTEAYAHHLLAGGL
ncbi:MAG: hypothetical protein KHX29_13055, partial [Prevotella buccalis]|nr:hypothetical protein [Hoylesella buccalis]